MREYTSRVGSLALGTMVASRFYGSIFSSTYYTYCSFITAIASRFYFCWKHWQFYATETRNCRFLLLTTKQAVSLNLLTIQGDQSTTTVILTCSSLCVWSKLLQLWTTANHCKFLGACSCRAMA
ncbi:unnamed protein product [Calypogeia fissa]